MAKRLLLFHKWKMNGSFEEIHNFVVGKLKLKNGEKPLPTPGIWQPIRQEFSCLAGGS